MLRFESDRKKTWLAAVFSLCILVFHTAVRSVRRSHGNAVMGLVLNIVQSLIMVLVFYLMFELLDFGGVPVRGDFLLYIMSGIFMFMTQTKALAAVVSADGPTSAMMKHAPMNPIISIAGAALGTLYVQIISAGSILLIYDVFFQPISIYDPLGTFAMFLLSWGCGVAIGMVFKAAMPWQPDVVTIGSQVYQRADMVASGKMFLANATPTYILALFTWNPLFHTIDQGRGYIFENYHPRYSSSEYPLIIMCICIVIGLMGQFYTRRFVSVSWGAKY